MADTLDTITKLIQSPPGQLAAGGVLGGSHRVLFRKDRIVEGEQRGPCHRICAESVFSRPVSKTQKAVLSRIAKRQDAGDESGIDYSEIPALTDEQLAQFKRAPKVLVAARIDKDVYDWLMKYGKGYSTRINGILRTVMERTC